MSSSWRTKGLWRPDTERSLAWSTCSSTGAERARERDPGSSHTHTLPFLWLSTRRHTDLTCSLCRIAGTRRCLDVESSVGSCGICGWMRVCQFKRLYDVSCYKTLVL